MGLAGDDDLMHPQAITPLYMQRLLTAYHSTGAEQAEVPHDGAAPNIRVPFVPTAVGSVDVDSSKFIRSTLLDDAYNKVLPFLL